MKPRFPLLFGILFLLIFAIGFTWMALTRDDRGTSGDDDIENSPAHAVVAPYALAA